MSVLLDLCRRLAAAIAALAPAPRRLAASLALLLVLAGAASAPAGALAARVDEADVEDEVMCVQCGRPLSTSSGSAADQERALITAWIAQGLTKAQIKQRLVAEYGERALVDDKSPVAAAAPWLAALAGALSIGFLLYRRRQRDEPLTDGASAAGAATTAGDVGISSNGSHPSPVPAPSALSAADEARIDAELAERD